MENKIFLVGLFLAIFVASASTVWAVPIVDCSSNADCLSDEYCAKDACDDLQGVCEPRPDACPDIYRPVCGCDGITYANACVAEARGQSVDYEGECIVPAIDCSSNVDCSGDEYCAKDACDDLQGVCESRPDACLYVWDPVCGCDGITYPNSCNAAAAGQLVDYEGECTVPVIDCSSNVDCSGDEYCAKDACDDLQGVCEPRPDACPDVWDPVCGCDGNIYGNQCEAASAGNSIGVSCDGPVTFAEEIIFSITPAKSKVTLTWTAVSEENVLGYYILRRQGKKGEYVQINDTLITAKGSIETTIIYELTDADVKNGRPYYYKLIEVETDGSEREHGPERTTPRMFHDILSRQ